MSKKTESSDRMPRRALLKSALMVLGASVIVQPSGAVFGLAQETPKKDDRVKPDSKTHIKGESKAKHSSTHKTSKPHKGTQKIKIDSTTPPAKKTS